MVELELLQCTHIPFLSANDIKSLNLRASFQLHIKAEKKYFPPFLLLLNVTLL